MNNTSFLRNISKATNKNDLINNFAKNFGLKEIIDLRPQKQVIKKLNAENKKIQKKINAQLFDLMQERKKVNEFIGDRDNEITSLEELNLVKRRASMTKLSKKKKKFSTINPKKKIDIFPSSTKSKVEAKFTKANIDGSDADEEKLSEYNAMFSQPKPGTASWTVSLIDGKSLANGKYTVRFTASNKYGE